jgi:hypothetical protein
LEGGWLEGREYWRAIVHETLLADDNGCLLHDFERGWKNGGVWDSAASLGLRRRDRICEHEEHEKKKQNSYHADCNANPKTSFIQKFHTFNSSSVISRFSNSKPLSFKSLENGTKIL